MMSDSRHTTGQVSGMTGIPPVTIQRYITEFREFFSDKASQRVKGRRYSDTDINRLLLIRHLHFERCSEDRIGAALRGEWTPPNQALFKNEDAYQLVSTAKQQFKTAGDQAKIAGQAATNAVSTVETTRNELLRLKKNLEIGYETRKALLSLPGQIMKLEAEITELHKRIQHLEGKPPQRGFFDRLLGE